MDKAFAGIVADPSQLQGHGRMSDRSQVDTRNGDIDCPAFKVETVLGNLLFVGQKQRVVGRRPVAGDDVDLVTSTQPLVDKAEVFNGIDVHDGLLVSVVTAQNPVDRMQGVEIISTVPSPESNGEAFLCVGVIE